MNEAMDYFSARMKSEICKCNHQNGLHKLLDIDLKDIDSKHLVFLVRRTFNIIYQSWL